MRNVLILGANGSIAREATRLFLDETDARLTLFLRDPSRLGPVERDRARVVQGDVLDAAALREAMTGQDFVYAGLAGDLERMARAIVRAMGETGVRRLVFISSMGIYDEVPGQHYSSVLDPYRKAAGVIEASDLDYTLLRPGWFTHDAEVDYQITQKGQPFQGHDVSLVSVSDLIVRLALSPTMEVRHSLGVSRA